MEFELTTIKSSENDKKRNITFPSHLTLELAEFVGIIIGDGNISQFLYPTRRGKPSLHSDIKIACNKKEVEYIAHIQQLFQKLFNLELKYMLEKSEGSIVLSAHSKGIVQFLNTLCEIPIKQKGSIVGIPSIIKNNSFEVKYAFLRGLADTDFSVSFQNKTGKGHNYPVIKASFKSKQLVQDLEVLYRELGFIHSTFYNEIRHDERFANPTTTHSVYLYGRKNFAKWLECIGFSNEKFIRKVKRWQTDGVCAPSKINYNGRDNLPV